MLQIRPAGQPLDGETEDRHDAVHGLVLPADSAAAWKYFKIKLQFILLPLPLTVCAVVPVAGAGSVQAGTVLLKTKFSAAKALRLRIESDQK